MTVKEVNTWCRLCFARCPVKLFLADGQIIRVKSLADHICPVGLALGEIVHAPDRLLHPLRKKPDGSWETISWDKALDIIAGKLQYTAHRYGAPSVSIHFGQARSHYDIMDYVRRFCNIFGTPNLSSSSSQCYCGRTIGNSMTYGYIPVPDYARTKCILVWGCNPAASNPYAWREIIKAKERGAKLIVIDPRTTPLTEQADVHLPVQPGADRALTLGMLHVIIRDKLYNTTFVNDWTVGFEELAEAVKRFTPEHVSLNTGLTASAIENTARLLANTSPGCVAMGNALEQRRDGVQTVRAIAILQSICGNLDAPGGGLFNPGFNVTDIEFENHNIKACALGRDVYPLYYRYKKEAQGNMLADAILEGKPYPIKSMIIAGADPLLSFPNTGKVKKALEKLDFLAVMDMFFTDTARLADIVLPAASFLERDELLDLQPQRPLPRPALLPAVISCPGEAWPDWRFWFALAGRMDYAEQFPWLDYVTAATYRTTGTDIEIHPDAEIPTALSSKEPEYYKYRNTGFPTPSGKVELYSAQMEKLGYNPLPTDPFEPIEKDGLKLSAGARVSGYILSRFRNIPSLAHRMPRPLAEMSGSTAVRLKVNDGQIVQISTDRGEIQAQVSIKNVVSDAIFLSHGWADDNVNLLTDEKLCDPISGFPSFRTTHCTCVPSTSEK